jgi:hypothetical protein
VLALEAAVTVRFGKLHILINNAGVNLRKPVTDFTIKEWSHIQTTNVSSAFLMCRSFVPRMKGRNYGWIINLASIFGRVSLPGRTAYSTSKGALCGFTKSLALPAITGEDHRQQRQSRTVRSGDQPVADGERGAHGVVSVAGSGGPLGPFRGNRRTRGVFVF